MVEGRKQDGQLPRRFANRYTCFEVLGSGGNASVYRASDEARGALVALKQLHTWKDAEQRAARVALFEREFHVLSQLRHPHVVAVHDYGVDPTHGPFYTMELLSGGDLRDRAPLDWRTVCRLAFDVCSSLALLHSRRLLHRDITPRNIRCTQDGAAKLIDFGALGPMAAGGGETIGTPAYTPPEAVIRSALDARSDLFSLGATLYYALTGASPYAVRSFSEAFSAWCLTPPSPSTRVNGIPTALDDLVLGLLQMEPASRPQTAFEVMQRLAAIAGLSGSETAEVSRAYLSTPRLVGRDDVVNTLRERLACAKARRGSGLYITGLPGSGRSRMLDVCALEAKIQGVVALRTACANTQADFGVALALAQHLVEALPSDIDTERFADLFETSAPPSPSSGAATATELASAKLRLRPNAELTAAPARLQRALERLFLGISRTRLLLLAIDDAELIDRQSAAVLLALVDRAPTRRLLVALTLDSEHAPSSRALELLAGRCDQVHLAALSPAQMRVLLGSVFGHDAANLGVVTSEVTRLAQGNPGHALELAQHLVDHAVVRYAGGTWTLPASLAASDLPRSAQETMSARIQALAPLARAIAESHALAFHDGFKHVEYRTLCAGADTYEVDSALSELLTHQLIIPRRREYILTNRVLASSLLTSLDETALRERHRALATLYTARSQPLARIHHLFEAGLDEEALEALIARNTEYAANPDHARALELNAVSLGPSYARGIATAIRLGRAPRVVHELRRWMVATSTITDPSDFQLAAPQWLAQLKRDSGFDAYQEDCAATDPNDRLTRAIARAHAAYQALPEFERVYTVQEAITHLCQYVLYAQAIAGRTMDPELVWTLPELLEPFAPLSPAVATALEALRATCASLCEARYDDARTRWARLHTQLTQLQSNAPPVVEAVRAIAAALGVLDAALGASNLLSWAEQIETDPLHRVTAIKLRMLSRLQVGDWSGAERLRRHAERVALRDNTPQVLASLLTVELSAYAQAEDFAGVLRATQTMETLAERFPGWAHYARDAKARFHLVRGDFTQALTGFEGCLAKIGRVDGWRFAGIPVWITAQTGRCEALLGLDRVMEAYQAASTALDICEAAEVGFHTYELIRVLALAEAKLGRFEHAIERVSQVIQKQCVAGVSGLRLGMSYEVRARIAIWQRDEVGFETFAQLTAREYRYGARSPLSARYERLVNEARRSELRTIPEVVGLKARVRTATTEDAAVTRSVTRTQRHSKRTRHKFDCS